MVGAREPNEMHRLCQIHVFLGNFQQNSWLLSTLASLSMSFYIEYCCSSQIVSRLSTCLLLCVKSGTLWRKGRKQFYYPVKASLGNNFCVWTKKLTVTSETLCLIKVRCVQSSLTCSDKCNQLFGCPCSLSERHCLSHPLWKTYTIWYLMVLAIKQILEDWQGKQSVSWVFHAWRPL